MTRPPEKRLLGAFWLGLMLALGAVAYKALEGFPYPRTPRTCSAQCMHIQVKGLGKADGVYNVASFTRLGDFLALLGKHPSSLEKDMFLEDWTCLDFSDPAGNTGPKLSPVRESVKYLMGHPMDLNRAGIRDLMLLPGIGPGLARKVVQERRRKGLFQSPEDLARVKSLPRKTLDRLRGLVGVQG